MQDMIGKLNVDTASFRQDEDGKAEITFQLNSHNSFSGKRIVQAIKEQKAKGAEKFVLAIDKYKNKRSINQNDLMWGLLTALSYQFNEGRTGGIKPEDLYIQALEEYGTPHYITAPIEEFEHLQKMYRVVKIVDWWTGDDGMNMGKFKCIPGSSKYDTKEMYNLIEGVFDMCAQVDVDSYTMQYWKDEWEGMGGQ